MKRIFYKAFGLTAIFMQIFVMVSCNDLFTNPLKDKETGEDLTLLLLDPNFFTTTFSISVIDAQTKEEIGLDTKLYVGDENGYDVVDFSGQKGEMVEFTIDQDYKETFFKFHTSTGLMELALDPTFEPSEQNPVNISFKAEVEGYESITTFEKISSTGTKTIIIEMLKKPNPNEMVESTSTAGKINESSDGLTFNFSVGPVLKAATATARPYAYFIDILFESLLKFKDLSGNALFSSEAEILQKYQANPNNFAWVTFATNELELTAVKTINGESTLHTLFESVLISKLIIDGKEVANLNGGTIYAEIFWNSATKSNPDYFGFWDNAKSSFIGRDVSVTGLDILYYTAYSYVVQTCNIGASININSTTADKVGFDITMDLMNASSNSIGTKTFKGLFSESFKFENVTSEPVTLKFKNDFFSFKPISDITVNSLCSGVVNVNVEAAEGYELYEVTLEAICPDGGGIGVSPSYQGKYKPKGDQNTIWQGITMKAGVFRILCKPKTEYSLKINIDGKDEFIDFSTDDSKYPVGVKASIGNDTYITNLGKEDGINRVKITHNFTQDICDNLGF